MIQWNGAWFNGRCPPHDGTGFLKKCFSKLDDMPVKENGSYRAEMGMRNKNKKLHILFALSPLISSQPTYYLVLVFWFYLEKNAQLQHAQFKGTFRKKFRHHNG